MKKSLVALAALAFAGAATAQSSVTLFGVVDTGISSYSSKTVNALGQTITTSRNAVSSSGYNSSRLGFRGAEDLGGGLSASFWLEAGVATDTGIGSGTGGGLIFNRRSTVSLSGSVGEIRLGRDYTPTFYNDTIFDPFGTNGVGTNLISTANGFSSNGALTNGFTANSTYPRTTNSIGYFLPPNLGGVYGQLMYSLNEQTSYDPASLTPPTAAAVAAKPSLANTADNARAGRYVGGRLGYTTPTGAFDIALAYSEATIASNYFLGTTTNLATWNIGTSYDFGPVKLFGEYSNNKLQLTTTNPLVNPLGFREPGANGWLLGVTVPVGAGLIRIAYSVVDYNNTTRTSQVVGAVDQPKSDKWALGYVYNLSKRTALYATVARINNKNGADLLLGGPDFYAATAASGPLVPKCSTGYDLGIRHAF